jgi:hypothetical protein
LQTEPVWTAAPDISVSIVSKYKTPQQIEHDIYNFYNKGAEEFWVVDINGKINCYKQNAEPQIINIF